MDGRDPAHAAALIEKLGLSSHPEGGWYLESWRADAPPGERGSGTAIWYLLEQGQRSHWHRVDATEIWHFYAGTPLLLRTAPGNAGQQGASIDRHLLGPDVLAGQLPQIVIAKGDWQAAEARDGWALVGCTVSPAFEFAGFELASQGWSPGNEQVDR